MSVSECDECVSVSVGVSISVSVSVSVGLSVGVMPLAVSCVPFYCFAVKTCNAASTKLIYS